MKKYAATSNIRIVNLLTVEMSDLDVWIELLSTIKEKYPDAKNLVFDKILSVKSFETLFKIGFDSDING